MSAAIGTNDAEIIEIDLDGPEQEPDNINSAQKEQDKNKRPDHKQGNKRGGGGVWRGFDQDRRPRPRGWGPPSQNYNRPNYGTTYTWGRGFGPAGPPIQTSPEDNMPLRYLMRCGVPKDKLRNLPRDFLQFISPEYCGLCCESFENFEMSRAHYVSNYHYKRQKRWVFQQYQQLEGGHLRPKKEPPLKSRDLYCELCDVQITSKAHADSHYAGRPHRAIVDGRKPPKNIRLQKRGMESRVDQLIRREQKYLKPMEKLPIPELPERPFQPDLYCQICKTSVTCSEQMRMHLNGKKHLTKEKQHILKMMNGGVINDDNEKAGATEEDEGEYADSQEEGGDDESKYDWGKGSGTWDDPQ